MRCVVCGRLMSSGLESWHSECACGYEASTLEPVIGTEEAIGKINESIRQFGLKPLRDATFGGLVDLLAQNGLANGAVLDVGCAHGWFLDCLTMRGYAAIGIEPDDSISNGHPLTRSGFFPDALRDGELFDAITFNDVFEHIPRPDLTMQRCFHALKPGGLLLINSPDSDGALYRLSKEMNKVGLKAPWRRMWQVGLPSPHLSYFNEATLRRLADNAGFAFLADRRVDSISRRGLWQRIVYAKTSTALAVATYISVSLAKPLLDRLPSDTKVYLFQKPA